MASIMEGPLSKWTNVMKGWQYRWFVLDYNAGLLSYYTSKDKMMRGSRRGCVRLRGAVIGIDDEDDSTFTITVDQKTFHFQARDADEREKWIHALEETILRHTLQLQISTTLAFFQSSGISPVLEFSKIIVSDSIGLDSGFVPSVQDFDKKLTEADAYLQILIEQLKLFDDKLQNCKDDEQRKKIETLKETTNSMVESIKHCIVLLQIAKDQCNAEKHADGIISTINPVDAIYQPSPLEPVINTMPSQTVLPPEPAQLCKSEQRPSSLPVGPVLATLGHHQTPTPNSTGSGHSPPSSSLTSPSHVNLSPNTVPEFSYSSSEDEFYDADEFHQSGSSPKRLIDSSGSASVLTHSSSGNSLKRPDTTESLNSSMSNGTSDADLFDSYDDRDDEGEAGSVEEHKSVIMHLLSQVRLGMDLTKVVLPTFILERRSLLEMYADFFAHPDLFVSSPNDKKSFCSIEGEWNGVMYVKYATGENAVFIDTKKLPIIKKKVRKLEDQNEYESRCLWKDVTFNLKIRDIDAATEAKHRLEERQRAEARERKEKEIQWETRLFHEDGECWVYDEPLLKRLGAAKH
ncbi:oxysterol-binding protein-related protein 9 isoform X17 [Myotis lucifugus]|uniref:oxysterol-binding protein-related protein 9 isoform X17 n=1 Tax=Myotis lucifugus TaxID=59463 RepID=UPI000CCC3AC1|nr:oxysterol-binding protein-related protein 9 isoform X17 [Myotis lucifugus]